MTRLSSAIHHMIRLTDEQRTRTGITFGRTAPYGRGGRKPAPARRVFEAALWILNAGARWHMLPQCCPSCKTVPRRLKTTTHSHPLGVSPRELSRLCPARLHGDPAHAILDGF
ncbi:MAG: transposase [Gammaproteobacteria bacterium]|nr:transposase [Gammaproteobacteria bacterium]